MAQVGEEGIDAINYGPGATAYAHRQYEQIPIANLQAMYETRARPLWPLVARSRGPRHALACRAS